MDMQKPLGIHELTAFVCGIVPPTQWAKGPDGQTAYSEELASLTWFESLRR